jgi:hypothetical protein
VSDPTLLTPLADAVIDTVVALVTDAVVTPNVAVMLPPATVIVAGTLAAESLLDRETKSPPEGAGPLNVTVPVAEEPAVTLDGLIDTDSGVCPSAADNNRVTVEFAAIPTLSCIWPPYVSQVVSAQAPVIGMVAADVVVSTTLTPGV